VLPTGHPVSNRQLPTNTPTPFPRWIIDLSKRTHTKERDRLSAAEGEDEARGLETTLCASVSRPSPYETFAGLPLWACRKLEVAPPDSPCTISMSISGMPGP
jgi:hypothetical protein